MKIELNKTYQGDCLELMKFIPDKSVDMVLCDLPYGMTSNIWDKNTLPIGTLWEHWNRICHQTSVIVLTSIQPFTSELVLSNKKKLQVFLDLE